MTCFIPSKKSSPCPVCGDTSGDCRSIQDSESILCKDVRGSIPGWKDLGAVRKNPVWHTFVPDDGQSSISWQDRLEERNKRKAEAEAREQERRSKLKPVAIRDAAVRGMTTVLFPHHRQSLLDRGLTNEEIDQAVAAKWLYSGQFGNASGFHISAVSLDGKIQGSQFARDDRGQVMPDGQVIPKYQWVSQAGSIHLPETGENPLFIWRHPKFDPKKPVRLETTEGALKPMISAIKDWRSGDYQSIWIGGGSIPGAATVSGILQTLIFKQNLKLESITLNPDAGWASAKPNVKAYWEAWLKPAWELNQKPVVRWWGQFEKKSSNDIDELDGSEQIRTIGAKAFLDLQAWRQLKRFTPDETIESEYAQFAERLKEGLNLFFRAGLGAGKTHEMIRSLKMPKGEIDFEFRLSKRGLRQLARLLEGRAAIVIVPTRKLAREFVKRARAAGTKYVYHLQNDNGRQFLADPGATIVLCPDSLPSLRSEDFQGKFCVIDEAVANWAAMLTRNTKIKDCREEAIAVLRDGLSESYANLFLDGNLSDKCCEFWQGLASGKESVKLQHQTTRATAFNIYFLDTPDDKAILEEIDKSAGKHPIVIVSDSRTDIEAFDRRFKALGLKGYAIHAESDKETNRIVFGDETLDTPSFNETIEAEKPDYLLISPAAGSGLDISVKNYFKRCFLLGRGVCSIDDLTQLLARLRDIDCPRTVWVPSKGKSSNTSISQARSLIEMSQEIEDYIRAVAVDAVGQDCAEMAEARLTELIADQITRKAVLTTIENLERKHHRAYLLEALIASGHNVEVIGKKKDQSEIAQQDHRISKLEQSLEVAQALPGAAQIDLSEAEKLKSRESLTESERLSLKRHSIVNRLPGIDESNEWNDPSEVVIKKGTKKEPVEIHTTKQAVFVDRLLNGRLVSQAEGQYAYFQPEIPRQMQEERWLEILFGEGKIKTLKSRNLTLATLRKCGLDDVLFSGGFFTDRPLKPLQGAGKSGALPSCTLIYKQDGNAPDLEDDHRLINSSTPTVVQFLQNCRKKANRTKLGAMANNPKRLLSDALEMIGLKMVEVEKIEGERFYRIENEIPRCVQEAIERRFEQIAERQGLTDRDSVPIAA